MIKSGVIEPMEFTEGALPILAVIKSDGSAIIKSDGPAVIKSDGSAVIKSDGSAKIFSDYKVTVN